VGREAVLARLHAAWAQARQGWRQVCFVTGEAGIGKTAVVEAFAAQVATAPGVWLAQGQCVEHYGTREAYLPVLEALGQRVRAPGGARLVALLRQQAPTWLVQLPWLLTDADRAQFPHELQGTTRERMLRELAEVLETLTAETPLVLVLEDLHWSD
jgi:predicted ATPase